MLVVTPNPCFDRTLWVGAFAAGTVTRPHRVRVTAGGKGLNVARTATDVGGSAVLLALVGEHGADELGRLASVEGLDLRGIDVEGTVRSATIVIEDSQRATVLNEPGPIVDPARRDDLLAAVAAMLRASPEPSLVVCSGSLPPGLPADTYGRITDLAHEHGGRCVVDGAREALAAALPAGPDLVCPNLDEAEGLATGAIPDGSVLETSGHAEDRGEVRDRALSAARSLRLLGARRVAVTAGEHGVAYVDADGALWTDAPVVAVANPIGAGDSFVGGVAVALEGGATWAEAVRRGVLVGAAAVEDPRAGHVDPQRVAELTATAEEVAG